MFQAKVVLDSVGPNGRRLITVEATYPRFVHAEVMTHRDRARNAASSRAIPWTRYINQVNPIAIENALIGGYVQDGSKWLHPKCMKAMILKNPVIPLSFDGEQSGMQSAKPVEDQQNAQRIWIEARDHAIHAAQKLADLGVHKSLCNRLTEPFMWITTLMTATEWKNFFRLRCHPDAEKHFQKIAYMIRAAIDESHPEVLGLNHWHMPYIQQADREAVTDMLRYIEHPGLSERVLLHKASGVSLEIAEMQTCEEILREVSAARCARLSYLTHEGKRDLAEDMKLFDKLIRRTDDVIHASPLEHVARATNDPHFRSGPFSGWEQLRKKFPNENQQGI